MREWFLKPNFLGGRGGKSLLFIYKKNMKIKYRLKKLSPVKKYFLIRKIVSIIINKIKKERQIRQIEKNILTKNHEKSLQYFVFSFLSIYIYSITSSFYWIDIQYSWKRAKWIEWHQKYITFSLNSFLMHQSISSKTKSILDTCILLLFFF